MFRVPNQWRVRRGPMMSDELSGHNGAFMVPHAGAGVMQIIASDQGGWEHVSVSLPHRCPTWDEMCEVKAMFWDEEDCVVQYHPPASEYVNKHPYCLHLWRPTSPGVVVPMPPKWMIG